MIFRDFKSFYFCSFGGGTAGNVLAAAAPVVPQGIFRCFLEASQLCFVFVLSFCVNLCLVLFSFYV